MNAPNVILFPAMPESLQAVAIEHAAMQQGLELEEELLKLRLKQRCFVALAELSPQSVVAGLNADHEIDSSKGGL